MDSKESNGRNQRSLMQGMKGVLCKKSKESKARI